MSNIINIENKIKQYIKFLNIQSYNFVKSHFLLYNLDKKSFFKFNAAVIFTNTGNSIKEDLVNSTVHKIGKEIGIVYTELFLFSALYIFAFLALILGALYCTRKIIQTHMPQKFVWVIEGKNQWEGLIFLAGSESIAEAILKAQQKPVKNTESSQTNV